jgi:acetyl-CoA C-acetyltransferase
MKEVWIIDAVRTPRGVGKKDKGALSSIHPQRLLSTVLGALESRNNLNTKDVDDVIAGCAMQMGHQSQCIARMAALDAGWDNDATGVSVDRFCGSGLTAINLGAMGIMSGQQDLIVAGGVESMSYALTQKLMPIQDSDNLHLRKLHPIAHQGVCADVIATKDNIKRSELESLALESQKRAAQAIKEGRFDKSVVPVYKDDGSLALDKEEYPRPNTTLESLEQLAPAFIKLVDMPLDETGTTYKKLVQAAYPEFEIDHRHHAGTSSGIVDGAAAVLLASPEYAMKNGLTPRAKVRAVANAGAEPELMLTAPMPATEKCLEKAGLNISDIDLFEVNEAFAVVPLKYMRDLDINPSKVNVNGGAMALGHPIGATGAILLGTLLDELERQQKTYGLVTLCTGGGQAPAMIIERM